MEYTDRLVNDDICQNKHQGNPQSEVANRKVRKAKDRQYIIDYLKKNKFGTSKGIANVMGKQLNTVSGRFSELKADNIICETGDKLNGCAIYKLKEGDKN